MLYPIRAVSATTIVRTGREAPVLILHSTVSLGFYTHDSLIGAQSIGKPSSHPGVSARLPTSSAVSLAQLLPAGFDLEVRPFERRRSAGRTDHVIRSTIAGLVGVVGRLDLEHFLAKARERDRQRQLLLP